MKPTLPENVLTALANAERSPGWNNRRRDVQRFTLPNCYGHAPCELVIVPFARWAYRRQEKAAAAWRAQREHDYVDGCA